MRRVGGLVDAELMNTRPGPMTSGATLSARNLCKSFGSVVALNDVSLDLPPGESVAVMGPSGSGKSTLLHCLAGLARSDRGEVRLEGQRVDQLSERQMSTLRRDRYGFVFQSDQLLVELHAVENVALPLMLQGVSRRKAVARAAAWFEPLGLAGLQRRRPGQLSGGQVQRVAIARSLVVGPAVIFADEPTAALDRATGHSTMDLLTSTSRNSRCALLVVTHDPEVAATCDWVVTMRDGRVLGIERSNRPAPALGAN